MKRASRHRKRHKPPGPCGVLWSMSKSKTKQQQQQEEEEFSERDKHGKVLLFDTAKGRSIGNKSSNEEDDDDQDNFTPPAWNAMLQSLNIPTPYIPRSTRGNIPKRFEILRRHLPEQFILLQEIHQGRHDLQMSNKDHYLCAWVETVEEQNSHHGIWTVGLKDETGARIRAWMEPNFVKEELQKTTKDASLGVVRVGVVWMLSNFSMIAIQQNSNASNHNTTASSGSHPSGTVERMLVVSGKRIQQVWTPESNRLQIQPNEDEDSFQAQQDYLDWMAKRNALTMDENLYDEKDRNHPDDDDDEDDPPNNVSRMQLVGDNEKQIRMAEMSALTMTADDDHSMIASQHEGVPSDDDHRAFNANANVPDPSRIQPKPSFAQTNSNPNDKTESPLSRRKSRNHDTERKRENEFRDETNEESQALLQTQESIRMEHKTDGICHTTTELSSQQPQLQLKSKSSNTEAQKHKKKKKQKPPSPMVTRTPTRQSPKRRRPNRSPNRNSPIRMSQSVWNTPDPSILELLNADSDGSSVNEEDEIPTVMDEDGTSLTFPTQFSNKPQNIPEPSRLDNHDDKFLYPTGRVFLGSKLFEPSSWTGMDATAFQESDSE